MSTWLLQDSVVLDQAFDTPAPAKSWGWFGPMPAEASLFETPATPWSFDFSPSGDLYLFNAGAPPVGGGSPRMMLMGVG